MQPEVPLDRKTGGFEPAPAGRFVAVAWGLAFHKSYNIECFVLFHYRKRDKIVFPLRITFPDSIEEVVAADSQPVVVANKAVAPAPYFD